MTNSNTYNDKTVFDVLNRIHANYIGIGKDTLEKIETDFSTIRAALTTPPVTVPHFEGLREALGYYDREVIGDPDRTDGPILKAARWVLDNMGEK